MKKFYLSMALLLAVCTTGYSQFIFDVEVDPGDYLPSTVLFPASPLKFQVLFVGGTDRVQTTSTYGRAAGQALAKQWHDFIGFTPDNSGQSLGWVSVNHEMQIKNDSIGDGGGMTAFRVVRDPRTDLLSVVDQTLTDNRKGKFFNVDFVNTVGETGMNCGGIISPDGRIWTAEEWAVTSNEQVARWQRDTTDWKIGTGSDSITVTNVVTPLFKDSVIKRFQNLNWMVEIDPKQAVALRKQYNWGRQYYEGGAIMPDNKTVYLGEDDTPGLFTKFVADVAGDFTKGKTYVYKHDASGANWVEMNTGSLTEMLNFQTVALSKGASMFNRLEWLVEIGGKVYMAETGRDNFGSSLFDGAAAGGVVDAHFVDAVRRRDPVFANKPESEILEYVKDGNFMDYYGRVLVYDPATDEVEIFLEGGPFLATSPELANYPAKHLSNPDGLGKLFVGNKTFMIVQEDLNGRSNGRVPAGVSNNTCEMFLLDMSIQNPTISDLIRIGVVPRGAEVTGAVGTPDGKTILCNSQHPATSNPFPYNNSLTFAITGWDFAVSAIDEANELEDLAKAADDFVMYPNPVSRFLNFNKVIDAAIYSNDGKRLKVYRNVEGIDVTDLKPGMYILKTSLGVSKKLVIE